MKKETGETPKRDRDNATGIRLLHCGSRSDRSEVRSGCQHRCDGPGRVGRLSRWRRGESYAARPRTGPQATTPGGPHKAESYETVNSLRRPLARSARCVRRPAANNAVRLGAFEGRDKVGEGSGWPWRAQSSGCTRSTPGGSSDVVVAGAPVVRGRAVCRSTTGVTGRMAGRTKWRTWSRCAGTATG